MKTRAPFYPRSSFTLIEMLAAMTVLFILMVVVFSIVGYSLTLSNSLGREADSGIEAKEVLDRIGRDIAGMVISRDVDQFYYKTAGNDKMFFYSQQTGYFASGVSYTANQSPVSLIGYRINTSDNPTGLPMLERLARGLTVGPDANGDTAPMQYLTFSGLTSVTATPTLVAGSIPSQWGTGQPFPDVGSAAGNYDDGANTYYHIVGSDVFRFEICFQDQSGTNCFYSPYPGYTNSAPAYPASITNTVAVVVALAILDAKSRLLVPTAGWTALTNSTTLPDPTVQNLATNGLMNVLWNNALQSPTFAATAGIPAVAASHIKIYQRSFYLNAPKAQ